MNTGLISSRYASALLDYAIGLNQQDEVYTRMKVLSEMFMLIKGLRNSLANPSVSVGEKKKLLVTACGGTIVSSLDKIFDVILSNNREENVQTIALRFIDLYREKFNIRYGKLITAVPVNEEVQNHLAAHIERTMGGTVEFEPITDPSILGGFMLSVGDFRWDASVAGELSRIRNKLNELSTRLKPDVKQENSSIT